MSSNIVLVLLLHVCSLATVKAFPTRSSALTPFQLPDLGPNLRDRADTRFVTVYGLYDNSLHTPTLDTSNPKFVTVYGLYDNTLHTPTVDTKLAPITEAFMAMTRTLATPTTTGSASLSVINSATPTPLHKTTPSSLGPSLTVHPMPVQASSTSPSPTDISQDILQRAAETHTHRLVVFGSIIAGVVFLGLLLFLLLDPRMMRKLCGVKVDSNLPLTSKGFYRRPKPTWDAKPISSSNYPFVDDPIEKSLFATKSPDNIKDVSKFSICSSEYSQSLSESEHDCGTPKNQTCPVRPPRPPTADSPALSESVYLAYADQPYIIVAPQPFTDDDLNHPAIPTGPKIFSRQFFNMYSDSPVDSDINTTLPLAQINTIPEFYDTRHSRTYSAPLLVGSLNDDDSISTAAQRMLKRRRSRSTSGWAYPDRSPPKGL